MRIRTFCRLAVLGLFVVVGVYGVELRYQSERESQTALLAQNIYFEASDEPNDSAKMTAVVVGNRVAKSRLEWGEEALKSVIFARAEARGKTVCQFSWTCDPRKREGGIRSVKDWARAVHLAQEVMDQKVDVPVKFQKATHYLNEKYSSKNSICWFKTSLVYLGRIEPGSHHEFYREPVDSYERKALPSKSAVQECKGLPAPEHKHKHLRKAA